MSRRLWSIVIVVGVLLPLAAATARGTGADSQSLYVTFRSGPQRIAVALADGTPVGTTAGAPTVIPAGPYNLSIDDSAGIIGPTFDLKGPGVSVSENMFYGEIASATLAATFAPSSTYTWRNDEQPSVVFTFVTSSTTGSTGSGSSGATSTGSATKTGTPAKEIVGSAIVPFRGTLAGTVNAAGKVALTKKGKTVSTLQAGLYTITVVDKSTTSGFAIQRLHSTAITLTSPAYHGTHVNTVNLKVGQWTFFSPGGKKSYFIVVA